MTHVTPAGRAIEGDSFDIIDRLCPDRPHTPRQWPLVRRLIHTSGDTLLNGLTLFHPNAMEAGRAALRRGAPVVVDVRMIAAGLTPARLTRFGSSVHPVMELPDVEARALKENTTKAVQGMRVAAELGLLNDAVVGIGNAPTALLELLRLVETGATPPPALVVGMPVGFVAAAESKEALAAQERIPWIIVRGTRGGSTLVVAALHALLDAAMETP